MPSKARQPMAPIDRPLSRAYLRQFTGWSTAFPPGLSDPASLRVMENTMVQRNGALRIRPGLRYMSYADAPAVGVPGTPIDKACVGTHEPFFLNNGSKGYLMAVREVDDTVGFRVLGDAGDGNGVVVHELDDPGIDFDILGGINFGPATTYVKYLQIDNKVFALSNAGETMRYFTVGASKTAKALEAVSRPNWDVLDKLTVLEPEAAWISSSAATSYRYNLATNPSFENNLTGWLADSFPSPLFDLVTQGEQAHSGTRSVKLSSKPQRKNYIHNPAHLTTTYGVTRWTNGSGATSHSSSSNGIRTLFGVSPQPDRRVYLDSEQFLIEPSEDYRVAWNHVDANDIQTGASATGVLVRFYNSSGTKISESNYTYGDNVNRRQTSPIPAPGSAASMSVHMWCDPDSAAAGWFTFKDVVVCKDGEDTTYFDGDSGANYYWTGTAGLSASALHPPQDCYAILSVPVEPGALTVSAYVRAKTTVRACSVDIDLDGGAGSTPVHDVGATTNDASGSWTRVSNTATGGAGITHALIYIKIAAVPHDEYHYVDDVLVEQVGSVDTYFDGGTTDTTTQIHNWQGDPNNSISREQVFAVAGAIPTAETKTANTLISSTAADNDYNFGFFYTFSTEIGESAASQVTVKRAQRGWQQWRWETPNASGEPSGTATNNGDEAADQLVAIMPEEVFDQGVAEGAIQWNLYAFTWSDQDPVPVTAFRIASQVLDATKTYDSSGWARMTPMMSDAVEQTAPLPTLATRRNYTEPSRGGQGLVASDRMIMVYDPASPAVIRWTSNQQGSYTDFSAGLGGGYKTLTSGNLFIPAAVKLWQNPQSVDTLTILCVGVDGMSAGYYMAPAQVASQSEAVNVMGFEETTATPGTTSPYGVEVLNNSLYHPLDEQLMKSVASNYNINHSSVTDQIQNVWRGLQSKELIVSSQHDNRLYYLVYNPDGAGLEDGARGNEVWVFDGQAKAGTWSRWLCQGVSLRKIENRGKVGMSLIRPDGIYYFDEDYDRDDYVSGAVVTTRFIPWYIESNTQGSNRSHDSPCHLQQANMDVGNFQGVIRYGVKGLDIHGKWRDISKLMYDKEPPVTVQYDRKDNLLIRKDMIEWTFYAGSEPDENGLPQLSSGQINMVQYRYTPLSVNVGGEYGSVETFEYGRGSQPLDNRTTENGVPIPMIDTSRP